MLFVHLDLFFMNTIQLDLHTSFGAQEKELNVYFCIQHYNQFSQDSLMGGPAYHESLNIRYINPLFITACPALDAGGYPGSHEAKVGYTLDTVQVHHRGWRRETNQHNHT